MTSQPERLSNLLWDAENLGEYALLYGLYRFGHERDSTYRKQLLETLRKESGGMTVQQQIQNAVDLLLVAWRNPTTS